MFVIKAIYLVWCM